MSHLHVTDIHVWQEVYNRKIKNVNRYQNKKIIVENTGYKNGRTKYGILDHEIVGGLLYFFNIYKNTL